MRSLKILFLCLCFISSYGFAEGKERRENKIPVVETTVQNNFSNVFRPIGRIFKRLAGIKPKPIYCPPPASVESLSLSKVEIVKNCGGKDNACSISNQTIDISTGGVDPENDILIYLYKVSGGKIVGEGAKVMWDLSDVKVGVYTITAGADDGCGVCGKTITKEIKVIECPDCRSDEN